MTSDIKLTTAEALNALKKSKLSIRQKDLLSQMTKEIQLTMDQGDWDFAVRLSFYRHEFAKVFKHLDWYPPFLEIRKVRDKIKIWVDASNERRKKREKGS